MADRLEVLSEKREPTIENSRLYQASESEKSGYRGLRVLEERNFEGPTSIKYWM